MKILYSCFSRSWGGMEMFTLTSVRQLLGRGHTVHLLCYAGSRLQSEAEQAGVTVHPFRVSGYVHPIEAIRLARLISSGGYSLIHTQASKDLWGIVPALALAGSSIPLFLTKQVGSFIVKKDALHRALYRRVTKAFAISKVIEKNLLETCPLKPEQVAVLHNSVDTTVFNPAGVSGSAVRAEFGVAPGELLIGMLARFSPGKGHEDFIYAAAQVSNKLPGCKFLIVGEASRGEDAYAESIKALPASYGLRNVLFAGFRNDTPAVLKALDIFVFPSHAEAFGIALAEAMAMGLPAVCSASDGVLDLAVEGETALLFEKQNREHLAARLYGLAASAELRARLGAAARERAVRLFDVQVLTSEVLQWYKHYCGDDSSE